jgi:hypothetical protein
MACLSLTACSPIKGYEGPELPREQTTLIKVSSSNCERCRTEDASIGPQSIGSRGVLLLPGKYELKAKVLTYGEPYDCVTESYIDDSIYNSCIRDRDEAERNGDYFARNCSSEAERTRTVCSVNYARYSCTGEISMVASESWGIVAQASERESPLEPGVASMELKPSLDHISEIELTKLHYLEKPVIPDSQAISECLFQSRWTIR